MANLDAIVGGVTYSLSDGTLCYWVGQDGLGMAPVHRLRERGPNQHGETDRGFRLDPRRLRLFFDVMGEDSGDVYDKRTELLRILGPQDDPVTLRWRLDNGDVRSLNADCVGDLSFPTTNRRGYLERAVVQMSAAEPSFYDPTLVSVSFSLVVAGAWAIPWAIPWPIGAGTLDDTQDIVYTGSWRSYPIIYVTGPLTDARIENLTTGDVLDFNGATIAAGDVYTIDCRYGYKTVVDSAGDNKIGDLTDDDDLATFHIAAPMDGSASRTNTLQVTGTNATALTSVLVQYYRRYTGI